MEEKGYRLDEAGFEECMNRQREMARKARKVTNYMGADVTVYESLDPALTSTFVGYHTLKTASNITAITTETEVMQALSQGDTGTIITEETPFYATMGGQCADHGIISTADAAFEVIETVKLLGGKVGHIGKVTKGMFRIGDRKGITV